MQCDDRDEVGYLSDVPIASDLRKESRIFSVFSVTSQILGSRDCAKQRLSETETRSQVFRGALRFQAAFWKRKRWKRHFFRAIGSGSGSAPQRLSGSGSGSDFQFRY